MDEQILRERMVATQIAARGVRDPRILEALREVPRHEFVPAAVAREAYDDRPLPIGHGQTISQPYIVALMTEMLAPRASDRVLEIGTGSDYQTAVLARLAREVISIERHAPLASGALAVFQRLGIANVRVVVGDGTEGWPLAAPYQRIMVTAGAPSVPKTLKEQLSDDGRLIIPVGPSAHQRVTVIERHGNEYVCTEGESCVFVLLVGRHGW